MPYKVMVIEDNEHINSAFCEIISNAKAFVVAGSYLNAEDALIFFKEDLPDIVLMDIDLQKMDGIECCKKIKIISPETIIIMVTIYENSKTVFDALCAGAIGYLTKNITSKKLISALEEAVSGGAPMSIKIAKMVVQSFQKAPKTILTDRETEVLSKLAKGCSYKSIALELSISPNTIKYHIKNIYDKLQVHNKEDAIREASYRKFI